VAVHQQVGTTQSPAFSTIARKPEFNEEMLAFFLLTPHPRMPLLFKQMFYGHVAPPSPQNLRRGLLF
jgi:hypothetical protein